MRSEKLLDVYKGEFRIFFNFYLQGQTVTLGFPMDGSRYDDVYVRVNGEEKGRISIDYALSLLSSSMRSQVLIYLPNLAETEHKRIIDRPAQLSYKSGGTCIRCGDDIPHNLTRPLCISCYKSWARWKNEDYPENYCHTCGKPAQTSYRKPECYSCYRNS